MNIVIDTYGSDLGPEEVIKGANLLLKNYENISLTLVGQLELITSIINPEYIDRIKVIKTTTQVTNYDNIVNSLYDLPNASIYLAIKELHDDDNSIGVISPGNSGAILLGAMKYLRSNKELRPCLGAILPTETDKFVCLVDAGATINCSSTQLVDFAILGQELMRKLYKIDSPKVGLLSNGQEETKGNNLVKETFPLLKENRNINFIGNVEANKALSGICDVLVTDGFSANIVLKVSEEMGQRIFKDINKYINATNNEQFKPLLDYLYSRYDISNLGGGILLGVDKPVIKCRGNSTALAILNTGKMLINMANNKDIYK